MDQNPTTDPAATPTVDNGMGAPAMDPPAATPPATDDGGMAAPEVPEAPEGEEKTEEPAA